eukprot:SAG11_NODE_17169_length_526_cov_0.960187_1_plen_58_part_00
MSVDGANAAAIFVVEWTTERYRNMVQVIVVMVKVVKVLELSRKSLGGHTARIQDDQA